MLVLSRKDQERLIIDVPPSDRPRQIAVIVVDIDRGRVRLGIEADRDIAVNRAELLEAKRA